MNKIRVLQVIGGMNRGGAETFLMNVLRNINKNKFELFFLCYGDGGFDYEEEIRSLGGKIVRIPDVKDLGVRKHIQHLKKVIDKYDIDVVHAHTYYNSVFSIFAARLSGVRLRIVHSHNTKSEPSPSLVKKIYFFVSKAGIELFANKFVACGEDAGKALYMPWRKFQVIYNGIDIQSFAYYGKNRSDVRNELGISQKATVLLHIGRFEEVKNHDYLIDIFAEYHKRDTSSKLVLVGVGPLKKTIEEKVEKLNLSDSVKFLGLRSDTTRIYGAADMLIFPSLFEGLPVVLVEAQANGIRCLVSDTIDKNIALTKCIEFYSLSKDAKAWAQRVSRTDFNRADVTQDLKGGVYDMSANIENIEKVYNEA